MIGKGVTKAKPATDGEYIGGALVEAQERLGEIRAILASVVPKGESDAADASQAILEAESVRTGTPPAGA
jgi:hypothetical protein